MLRRRTLCPLFEFDPKLPCAVIVLRVRRSSPNLISIGIIPWFHASMQILCRASYVDLSLVQPRILVLYEVCSHKRQCSELVPQSSLLYVPISHGLVISLYIPRCSSFDVVLAAQTTGVSDEICTLCSSCMHGQARKAMRRFNLSIVVMCLCTAQCVQHTTATVRQESAPAGGLAVSTS